MHLLLVFLIPFLAHAAPAMRSPLCIVTAKVEKIETRKEPYNKPESWRKAWGLPKAATYRDVHLKIFRAEFAKDESGTCTTLLEKTKFQLRTGDREPKPGECIQSKTQFSGDEFLIGQWLIEPAPVAADKCTEIKKAS